MSFQLVGLPYDSFAPLFALPDSELLKLNMQRVVASAKPSFPCRVSLADAEIGDELLLLPFEHQPADSPYRASGPIFVRKGALRSTLEPGVIPDYVRIRQMSVRAYDAAHWMMSALVCDGNDTASVIEKMFGSREIAYIHLHNATRGCFSCKAVRAT